MSMNLDEQYDRIYRYCYFKLHHRESAEDITQETFLRFFGSEGYQDTGRTLQYLYTIARNLCIDEYRRLGREPLLTEPEVDAAATDDREESILTAVALKEALRELSKEDRELLLLRYVNEVPVSVLCKLFGMSRFAVYRRTTGALKRLEKRLGREDFW